MSQHIVNNFRNNGYAVLDPSYYTDFLSYGDLSSIQASYFSLASDPYGGNRYRAYSRFTYDPESKLRSLQVTQNYVQTTKANSSDGGKVRKFPPIEEKIIQLPGIDRLIDFNFKFAVEGGRLDGADLIDIGLHQIRYQPDCDHPSYSSPLWLHRDDETVVFIHLFNLSSSSIGGDNLISRNPTEIEYIVRLSEPLHSLVVDRSVMHAVTPVGAVGKMPAFRDILLVTFEKCVDIYSRSQEIA